MARCPALAYTSKPDQLVVQCCLEYGHRGSHIEHQPQHQQENIMEQTLSNPGRLDYRTYEQYLQAPARAQEVIDAAIAALARVTSPRYGLDVGPAHNPDLAVSFEWHDGAHYRLTMTAEGELRRLFRLQYTGAWEWDEVEDREVPAEEWRTVRAFAKDRAGKVLGPALAGFPAATSWAEAAGR